MPDWQHVPAAQQRSRQHAAAGTALHALFPPAHQAAAAHLLEPQDLERALPTKPRQTVGRPAPWLALPRAPGAAPAAGLVPTEPVDSEGEAPAAPRGPPAVRLEPVPLLVLPLAPAASCQVILAPGPGLAALSAPGLGASSGAGLAAGAGAAAAGAWAFEEAAGREKEKGPAALAAAAAAASCCLGREAPAASVRMGKCLAASAALAAGAAAAAAAAAGACFLAEASDCRAGLPAAEAAAASEPAAAVCLLWREGVEHLGCASCASLLPEPPAAALLAPAALAGDGAAAAVRLEALVAEREDDAALPALLAADLVVVEALAETGLPMLAACVLPPSAAPISLFQNTPLATGPAVQQGGARRWGGGRLSQPHQWAPAWCGHSRGAHPTPPHPLPEGLTLLPLLRPMEGGVPLSTAGASWGDSPFWKSKLLEQAPTRPATCCCWACSCALARAASGVVASGGVKNTSSTSCSSSSRSRSRGELCDAGSQRTCSSCGGQAGRQQRPLA
jgi:hypothetical protein